MQYVMYSTAALPKQMYDEGCTFIIVHNYNEPVLLHLTIKPTHKPKS
jgi:hypothetical protein